MKTYPWKALALIFAMAHSPAIAAEEINLRDMAKFSGEKYVQCLAYNAIRLDDGRSEVRDLLLAAKERCRVSKGIYEFFVKKDSQADLPNKIRMDTILEALEDLALTSASDLASPLISSVRTREGD